MSFLVFERNYASCIYLLLLLIHGSRAIITSLDPTEAVIDSNEVPFFVSLSRKGSCAGAIISSSFIVTAAHCLCYTSFTGVKIIDYKDEVFQVVAAYQNPMRQFKCLADGPNENDVAVLQVAGDPFTSHSPVQIYSDSDEVGEKMTLLGMGLSGQPDDYPTPASCRNARSDEKLRRGYNTVDTASGVITYNMTRSSSPGAVLGEAIAQAGDSGSPCIINGKVAGVNSGTNEINSCDWGSVDMYCRLSEHATWISKAIDTSLCDTERGLWIKYRFNLSNKLLRNRFAA